MSGLIPRVLSRAVCTQVSRLHVRTAPLLCAHPLQQKAFRLPSRAFSSHTEIVPGLGDSISTAVVVNLLKKVGDYVAEGEVYAVVETDKVTVDIRASKGGKITDILAKKGDTLNVGQEILKLDPTAAPEKSAEKSEKPAEKAEKAPEKPSKPAEPERAKAAPERPRPAESQPELPKGPRSEHSVPLTQMRLTIANRLKSAQNEAAMLTTFNEIDMSHLMNMRAKHKEEFEAAHKVKLGFMSAFVKASAHALMKNPNVNALFDAKNKCITYRDYVDVSVAVSTPTGLVVPVLRDCQNMNFAQIEKAIAALGKKARDGQITKQDMQGGTFTISNGGVYGSLMGTPILNPPQSAILGMHGIFKRPVAVDDQVVIRPMMYVALTYDHRIIDGKDAVTFLIDVKKAVEDPMRLIFEL